MLSPSMEDYLKIIHALTADSGTARVSEIAERMHVRRPSVSKAIRRLSESGHVVHAPYGGVALTARGEAVARRVHRAHEVVREFLVSVLGVDRERAAREAEQLEHAFEGDSIERLARWLSGRESGGSRRRAARTAGRTGETPGGSPRVEGPGPAAIRGPRGTVRRDRRIGEGFASFPAPSTVLPAELAMSRSVSSPRRRLASGDPSSERPGLDPIFRPRSVAVVGASRRAGNIGRQILTNLIGYGFEGPVFPVNPTAEVVQSIKCYPRVSAVPDDVDLAIVVVPTDRVLEVVRDCGKKGVRGLVVITAGFRETGDTGSELEARLGRLVRRHGMRMIGPNCMGVLNTDPAVRLNGSFAATLPEPGCVGLVSQSGALGEVIMALAREAQIGVSKFASLGNKTDVDGNDLLEYFEHDRSVRQILMYLESFGRPREFTRIARRVSRRKPIITVKAGRTSAGARAASSHTGSIVGRDFATESLLEQCGVLRVQSMQEMLTLAAAFSTQPLPKGDRVAILTNAGGPGILATDACVQLGLQVAELDPKTVRALAKVLPGEATSSNPVDTTASGQPQHFGAALRLLRDDPGVDALIVLFVSPVMIDGLRVACEITEALAESEVPAMSCFMGKHRAREGIAELRGKGIPVFPFPEEAAHALAAMNRYREVRSRRMGRIPSLRVDREAVEKLFRRVRRQGRCELRSEEAQAVLEAYGIPVAPSRVCGSAAEAIEFGSEVGYPIVLKGMSDEFTHKTEHRGVVLDLRDGDEVAKAYRELSSRLRELDPDVRIQAQKMIQGGREVILGVVDDPQFGPLLLFGLGGIYVEILRDVSVRIHPITDLDARDMIRSTGGFPLLEGTRGEAGVDLSLLERVLLRLSRLVSDFDAIREMDVNPFVATSKGRGSAAVDVRISLHPA